MTWLRKMLVEVDRLRGPMLRGKTEGEDSVTMKETGEDSATMEEMVEFSSAEVGSTSVQLPCPPHLFSA